MSQEDRNKMQEVRRLGDTEGFAEAVVCLFGPMKFSKRIHGRRR